MDRTPRPFLIFAAAAGLTSLGFAAEAGAQTYRETTYTYGTSGLPQTVTVENPSGTDLVTRFEWDAAGNLLRVIDPETRVVEGRYRADRRLQSIVTGAQDFYAASLTEFVYDASGRLTQSRQALTLAGLPWTGTGSGTQFPHSLIGSDWIETDVAYEADGRVDTINDPDNDVAAFQYYNNGLLYQSFDGESRETRLLYYANGSTYCTQRFYQSNEQRSERVFRNFNGDTYVWFTGNHTSSACANTGPSSGYMLFDAFYRPTYMQYGNGSAQDWDLDRAGNRIANSTRAGQTQTFAYDASNRVTTETYPEGTNTYTYYRSGEQKTASWTGSGYTAGLAYTYDFAGRLIEEERTQDGRATRYQYDGSGNRTAIIWDEISGPDWTARYAYDGNSRLVLVCEDADGSTGTGSAGGVAGCNQILAAYEYDRLGRRERVDFHGGGGAGSSSTVSRYDNDSDLVRLTHDFSGTSNDVEFRHDYDGSGRLTATYANATGWMWSAGTTDFTRSYGINFSNGDTYDLDQVTHYADTGDLTGSLAYLYDGNGNLSNTSYSLYIHDSRNRLTTIGTYLRGGGWSPPSSTWASMSMRYDPAGRRITRTSTLSDNLIFLYAGDMLTAEVQDQSGQPGYGKIIRRFVPGPGIDDHVAMIDVNPSTGASTGYHYYHRDRLGNIIATADASGARTQRYVYTPFGVEEPWNTTGNPLRYNGQYRDGEAGLYYYRARYFDPQLGRFLETDPVGFSAGMNLYAYVGNNPLNATDPSGMFPSCAAYNEAGGQLECRDIEGASGESFDTLAEAVDAVGNGLQALAHQTGNEWGVIFSEQDDGRIMVSAAVSGVIDERGRATAGRPHAVSTGDLERGAEGAVIGGAHVHPPHQTGNSLPTLNPSLPDLAVNVRRANENGHRSSEFIFTPFGTVTRLNSTAGASFSSYTYNGGQSLPNPNIAPEWYQAVQQQVAAETQGVTFVNNRTGRVTR